MDSELIALKDSARQVVDDLGLAAGEDDSWALIADLGWLMVFTPEDLGGLGLGLAGVSALYEELGRGLASAPYISHMLAVAAVSRSPLASDEHWLGAMMSGERRMTAPLGESSITVLAGDDGSSTLRGHVAAVPSADRSGHVLIDAADTGFVALVDLQQAGITMTHRPTWDTTRRLFDLQFDNLALDRRCILAEGEAARSLSRRLSILRDFALAADSAGGAAALLEMTVEYLQTRSQFGRPLALFQSLKHRCADLKAAVEAAQALLRGSLAAAVDDTGDLAVNERIDMKARAAKQLACSTFASVAEESLQLHGGIGMTSEHDCHLFLKRSLLNEHLGRSQDSYEQGLAELFVASLA